MAGGTCTPSRERRGFRACLLRSTPTVAAAASSACDVDGSGRARGALSPWLFRRSVPSAAGNARSSAAHEQPASVRASDLAALHFRRGARASRLSIAPVPGAARDAVVPAARSMSEYDAAPRRVWFMSSRAPVPMPQVALARHLLAGGQPPLRVCLGASPTSTWDSGLGVATTARRPALSCSSSTRKRCPPGLVLELCGERFDARDRDRELVLALFFASSLLMCSFAGGVPSHKDRRLGRSLCWRKSSCTDG